MKFTPMIGLAAMAAAAMSIAAIPASAQSQAQAKAGDAQLAQAPKPASADYNWTGVYVGMNGGYGFGSESWYFPLVGTSANQSLSGGTIGATAGWNFYETKTGIGPLVFGIEGDFDWAGINGSKTCPNPVYRCNTSISNLGTLRGRVGYAVMGMGDRLLLFVTSGAAGGLIKLSTPGPATILQQSKMEWGWTVGAGAEYAFDGSPWTAKLEYLYADLGTHQFSDSAGELINVDQRINLIRAGVNVRF